MFYPFHLIYVHNYADNICSLIRNVKARSDIWAIYIRNQQWLNRIASAWICSALPYYFPVKSFYPMIYARIIIYRNLKRILCYQIKTYIPLELDSCRGSAATCVQMRSIKGDNMSELVSAIKTWTIYVTWCHCYHTNKIKDILTNGLLRIQRLSCKFVTFYKRNLVLD